MDIASLFADPYLLQLESEAMINTDNAPSKRSADATAPFAPKARENPVHRAKLNEFAETYQSASSLILEGLSNGRNKGSNYKVHR